MTRSDTKTIAGPPVIGETAMIAGGGVVRVILSALLFTVLAHVPTRAGSPSFDCTKAESSAEELVCNDDQLAALDREVARLFKLAREGEHSNRHPDLVPTQRGWIKGRDDCWKASDLRRCVWGNYLIRIHELRQGYANARSDDHRGISTGPYEARCEGLDALIGITFVTVDPPAAFLEWLDRFLVMELTPTGSGSRYAAIYEDGEYVFWVKGNEASFQMPGQDHINCRIRTPG